MADQTSSPKSSPTPSENSSPSETDLLSLCNTQKGQISFLGQGIHIARQRCQEAEATLILYRRLLRQIKDWTLSRDKDMYPELLVLIDRTCQEWEKQQRIDRTCRELEEPTCNERV